MEASKYNRSLTEVVSSTYSDDVHCMYDFLKYMIRLDCSIVTCEKEEFRDLMRNRKCTIHTKLVRAVMYAMVEILEKKIGKAMKDAGIGSISHDAWTRKNIHYITVLASFVHRGQPEAVLLTLSPLTASEHDDMIVDFPVQLPPDYVQNLRLQRNLANRFRAENYAVFIKKTFKFYGFNNVADWVVCQVTDNTAVMPAVANLLGFPHIGCKNHKLGLCMNEAMAVDSKEIERVRREIETDELEDADDATKNLFERLDECEELAQKFTNSDNEPFIKAILSCHKTMKNLKESMRAGAMLDACTHLVPILRAKQRWSGLFHLICRFERMYNDIVVVEANTSASVHFDSTEKHKSLVHSLRIIFRKIQACTVLLQERFLQLNLAWKYIDHLHVTMDCVEKEHGFHIDLSRLKLEENNPLVTHLHFESAVCKIQNDEPHNMNEFEKIAASKLRNFPEERVDHQEGCLRRLGRDDVDEDFLDEDVLKFQEISRNGKKSKKNENLYNDVSFIWGSAAEVERVWTDSSRVLTINRMSLYPQTFEAIMFLKNIIGSGGE